MKRTFIKIILIFIFAQILAASSRHESGHVIFSDLPDRSLHNIQKISMPDGRRGYSIKDISYSSDRDHLLTDIALSFDRPGDRYIRDDSGKYEIYSGNYLFSSDSGGFGSGCASFFMADHGVRIRTVNALWLGSCGDLGSFNVEFRFNARDHQKGVLFSRVGYFSGKKKGIEIILHRGRVVVYMHNLFQRPDGSWESPVLAGGSPVQQGRWYHFSLSFDRITGKLSRYMDGREEQSLYMTSGGGAWESVFIPSFAHRNRVEDDFKCPDLPLAEIGTGYNGFIDEFRISYTDFKDLINIKDVALSKHRGSSLAGRMPYNREGVITSPVYSFPYTGTSVTELSWQGAVPEGSFIWMEFRISDRSFHEKDMDLKWYRVENNQRGIFMTKGEDGLFLRGRYYQWRAHLIASPDGERSPFFHNVKIEYTMDKAPDIPMFLEAVQTGDRKVVLRWKKNVDHDLYGYRIYYGTVPGKFDGIISQVRGRIINNDISSGNYIEVTIDNSVINENKTADSRGVLIYPALENTVLYYFAVSAYDSYRPGTVYNHESETSEPVSVRPYAGSEIR